MQRVDKNTFQNDPNDNDLIQSQGKNYSSISSSDGVSLADSEKSDTDEGNTRHSLSEEKQFLNNSILLSEMFRKSDEVELTEGKADTNSPEAIYSESIARPLSMVHSIRTKRADSSPTDRSDTEDNQAYMRFSKKKYSKLKHTLIVTVEKKKNPFQESQQKKEEVEISDEDDLSIILKKLPLMLNEDEEIKGIYELLTYLNKHDVEQFSQQTHLKPKSGKRFYLGKGKFGCVSLVRSIGDKDSKILAVKKSTLTTSTALEIIFLNRYAKSLKGVAKDEMPQTQKQSVFLPLIDSYVFEKTYKKKKKTKSYQIFPIADMGSGEDLLNYFWKSDTEGGIGTVKQIRLRQHIIPILLNMFSELYKSFIFHRDFKPQNFLVGKDGKIFLSDVGSAIKFTSEKKLNRTVSPAGLSDAICAPPDSIALQQGDFEALGYPDVMEVYHKDEAFRFGLVFLAFINRDLANEFKSKARAIIKENRRIKKEIEKNKIYKPLKNYQDWLAEINPIYEKLKIFLKENGGCSEVEKIAVLNLLNPIMRDRKTIIEVQNTCSFSSSRQKEIADIFRKLFEIRQVDFKRQEKQSLKKHLKKIKRKELRRKRAASECLRKQKEDSSTQFQDKKSSTESGLQKAESKRAMKVTDEKGKFTIQDLERSKTTKKQRFMSFLVNLGSKESGSDEHEPIVESKAKENIKRIESDDNRLVKKRQGRGKFQHSKSEEQLGTSKRSPRVIVTRAVGSAIPAATSGSRIFNTFFGSSGTSTASASTSSSPNESGFPTPLPSPHKKDSPK